MKCQGFEGPCDACGSTDGVKLEDSRTAYEPKDLTRYDRLQADDPLNPPSHLERFVAANPRIPYCRRCAEEHHAFWDEQWAELYATRG